MTRAGGLPGDEAVTAPETTVVGLLNNLERSVQAARAERRRARGETMFECPCCHGKGTVQHGDTCVCCHGAQLVDDERLAWWDEWLASC